MTGLIGFCLYRFRLSKQGRYQEILSEFMRVISDSMRSALKEKYCYAIQSAVGRVRDAWRLANPIGNPKSGGQPGPYSSA